MRFHYPCRSNTNASRMTTWQDVYFCGLQMNEGFWLYASFLLFYFLPGFLVIRLVSFVFVSLHLAPTLHRCIWTNVHLSNKSKGSTLPVWFRVLFLLLRCCCMCMIPYFVFASTLFFVFFFLLYTGAFEEERLIWTRKVRFFLLSMCYINMYSFFLCFAFTREKKI